MKIKLDTNRRIWYIISRETKKEKETETMKKTRTTPTEKILARRENFLAKIEGKTDAEIEVLSTKEHAIINRYNQVVLRAELLKF